MRNPFPIKLSFPDRHYLDFAEKVPSFRGDKADHKKYRKPF